MVYKRKTEEERQKEVEELARMLEDGVLNASIDPERFKALLEMAAAFPKYSFRNVALIHSQMPKATYVASFKKFRELDRNVIKGQKAIRILAPRISKVRNDDTGKEENKIIGFLSVPVFDCSQTEGKPLPIEQYRLKLDGNSDEALNIIEAVKDLAQQDECLFCFSYVPGTTSGYYSPTEHRIVVSDSLSVNHKAKTSVHELVHSRVHRKNNETKEEQESVAEGAAFIVCSYFGLDTSSYSFEYIRGWSKEPESILKYCEQIHDAATSLILEFETYFEMYRSLEMDLATA